MSGVREERFEIGGVPALLLGEAADRLWLYVHGKHGSKEEARELARLACPLGWQVLGVDLPGHGARGSDGRDFDPWHAVPELQGAMACARNRWREIALYGVSLGAWFSMLAFGDAPPSRSLFVSPVVDMEALICRMMRWAGATEARLEAAGRIPTDFGEVLDWNYLCYAREHAIARWDSPTAILYGECDKLTPRAEVEAFAARLGCDLRVVPGGEHWFHTPEQLDALSGWLEEVIKK